MVIKKEGEHYTVDSKVIVAVGGIAVVLMLYFAVNMYQMVSHVGKLADHTSIMTTQIVEMNANTKSMSESTKHISSSIDNIDEGVDTVTSPRGMMNMWRR